MMKAHRLLVTGSILLGALGALGACGSKGGAPGTGDAQGSAVAFAPVGTGYAATQAYTVQATYGDGATADVTATARLSADDPSAVRINSATATVVAAGHYTITASLGGAAATADLTATLDDSGTAPGFDPGDRPKLDGTPAAGQVPVIAYPLAGALFPVNVAPIEIHAQKSDPAQSRARVTFTAGTKLHYSYYANCAPSPNPGAFPNACIVSFSGAFAIQLAGVSETDDIALTVRLVAADGSKLGESQPIALAWARTPLTGGLYYWTTAGAGDTAFNTAIARYDFAGDTSMPSIYLSSADAPAVPSGQTQCIGCHAVSPDGSKLSFSLGGSLPGYFSLYNVAQKQATGTSFADKFAVMSTYSPDAARMVTGSYGVLTLRTADATLGAITSDLFAADVTERKSHPFWSPSGQRFAFVSWTPSQDDITSSHITGDMVQGGQIWLAKSDGASFTSPPTLLVPRAAGVTSYYPAISDDDQFVVFNQSSCSGPANTAGWGAGPCDGYNDISAKLMVVASAGGTPIALARANGSDSPLTTNSWPRWSPDHGTFRGKQLYWVAYSSRRAYGLALAGATNDTTKPQLWFAAIAIDGTATPTIDPSFAPVWLPGQDPNLAGPRGNHTPAWTSKIVDVQ
jgi:hypothetical protein